MTSDDFNYLKRNGRRFKMNREETVAAFEQLGIPTIEPFIDFQVRFGGYQPDTDVTFGVVKPIGKYAEGSVRFESHDDVGRVRCDVDSLVQIRFWLGENGWFYYEQDPVAESFDSYIRFCAHIDTVLNPLGWTFIDSHRRSTQKFLKFLDGREAPVVTEASDKFHQIRRSGDLFWVIRKHHKELYVRPALLKKLR